MSVEPPRPGDPEHLGVHREFCALLGGGTPVYARPDGTSPVVGRLTKGGIANWFVGQAAGARFRQNTHWAYTLSDGSGGKWGWVPIALFRGGGGGAADATLAPCAARCHPY